MINPSDAKSQADLRMLPEHYRGCPYFGLPDDSETRIMFPINGGSCHRAEPTGEVELTYQQTVCLSAQHQACPVFLRNHKAPLPPEISGVNVRRSGSRRVLMGIVVIFVFALIGATIGLWLADSNRDLEALIPVNGQGVEPAADENSAIIADMPTDTPTAVLQTVEPTAVIVAPAPTEIIPSVTPIPTDTPTPSLPATFTPISPTATAVPPTAVPGATAVIDVIRLNVRLGPNTEYEAIGLVDEGTEYEVVGRLSDNSWLQICCVNGQSGWVIAEAVLLDGTLEFVPTVSDFPPLPGDQ